MRRRPNARGNNAVCQQTQGAGSQAIPLELHADGAEAHNGCSANGKRVLQGAELTTSSGVVPGRSSSARPMAPNGVPWPGLNDMPSSTRSGSEPSITPNEMGPLHTPMRSARQDSRSCIPASLRTTTTSASPLRSVKRRSSTTFVASTM